MMLFQNSDLLAKCGWKFVDGASVEDCEGHRGLYPFVRSFFFLGIVVIVIVVGDFVVLDLTQVTGGGGSG